MLQIKPLKSNSIKLKVLKAILLLPQCIFSVDAFAEFYKILLNSRKQLNDFIEMHKKKERKLFKRSHVIIHENGLGNTQNLKKNDLIGIAI